MTTPFSLWWITVRLDACRTQDEVIEARNAWEAGWLYRKRYPKREVIHVRPKPV